MASGFPMGQGQPYQELKWFGIFIQVAVGPAVPGGDVLLKMNLRGAFTILYPLYNRLKSPLKASQAHK